MSRDNSDRDVFTFLLFLIPRYLPNLSHYNIKFSKAYPLTSYFKFGFGLFHDYSSVSYDWWLSSVNSGSLSSGWE